MTLAAETAHHFALQLWYAFAEMEAQWLADLLPYTAAAVVSIVGTIFLVRKLVESMEYIIDRLDKIRTAAVDRINTHAESQVTDQKNSQNDEAKRILANSVSRILHELDATNIDAQQFGEGASEINAHKTTIPKRRPSDFMLGIAAWVLLRANHASAQTSLTTIGTAKAATRVVGALVSIVVFLTLAECSIQPSLDDDDDDDDDGCEPNTSTRCVGNEVYWFDSCGNMGKSEQSCGMRERCSERSLNVAECQAVIPPMCDNGIIDPGEDCDAGQLGGADCMSLGFDGGQLACMKCLYDTSQCHNCECITGECCDGCFYEDATVVCDAVIEYGCPDGIKSGNDVSARTREQFCSGNSSFCSGGFGQWSDWSVADNCSDSERCTPDEPTCNSCWVYDVTQHECPTFSAGGSGGQGGGEIFEICASTDTKGYVTMKARKFDGSNFGRRPYQVQVSAPGLDPCGPDSSYFVVSDSDPVGIGTDELTFSVGSQWFASQTEKAYCVTASTQVGDFGYDANSAQQQSWWYSEMVIHERKNNCN